MRSPGKLLAPAGTGTGPLPTTAPDTDTSPAATTQPAPLRLPEQEPGGPLVVILGPTAAGKTDLAITVARALDGEIVSADSRQLYRHMDIGTAKPTPQQRAAAVHHLVDVVTPDKMFTLAQYQRAAYETIDAIHVRDRLPLLVGGTGQYITAVIEGWGIPEVPPNPPLREDLESYAAQHGALALHDRLRRADPDAADRIDYRNVRRVVRALEVYLETGVPITTLQRKSPPPYQILQFGLTMPREQLYARIDQRIDRMIAAGLLDEVRELLNRGYTWDSPAMTGLGYIQWRDVLAGTGTTEDAIDAIRRDTRAFVRRQDTWFKGHDSGIHWLDATTITPQDVIAQIRAWRANL